MIHVQSSWFPLVDRNPQKFLKISEARAEDFQKATQRVYRSGKTRSSMQPMCFTGTVDAGRSARAVLLCAADFFSILLSVFGGLSQ